MIYNLLYYNLNNNLRNHFSISFLRSSSIPAIFVSIKLYIEAGTLPFGSTY